MGAVRCGEGGGLSEIIGGLVRWWVGAMVSRSFCLGKVDCGMGFWEA